MDVPQNGKEQQEKTIFDAAVEAAHIGGEVLLTHLSRVQMYEVERKAQFDFATQVDHASEQAIVDFIRRKFPDHKILAEEGGSIDVRVFTNG